MPARIAPDHQRGFLVALGADAGRAERLQLLLGLSSLRTSLRVHLLVAGHSEEDADDLQQRLVQAGAGDVRRSRLASRADCERREVLLHTDQADLALLMADSPLRLAAVAGGTALARTLRRRNTEGMAVAGWGGAAALLCEHMLMPGSTGTAPGLGGASLGPGFGLTNRVVVDQGGHASDRLARLLAALALCPFALGLGVDADTMAVIGPDNVLEVFGSGVVTLIDPAETADSRNAGLAPGAPIRITDLRLHALPAGARFDLDFRRLVG